MITPQEFIEKWKGSPLITGVPASINALNIPDISKQFLLEAGLPQNAIVSISFDRLQNELVVLSSVLELNTNFPSEFNYFFVLGETSGGAYICLDLSKQGRIIGVQPEYDNEITPINSSVPLFAESLLAIQAYNDGFNGEHTWERADILAAVLEADLSRIEPGAMRPDWYWPQFIFAISI